MYGQPALKVDGKWFACVPSHKSAEADSLAIHTSFEQRAELLAGAPDVYYIKDHYKNYPVVLVRLKRVRPEELKDLLAMSYRSVVKASLSKKDRL